MFDDNLRQTVMSSLGMSVCARDTLFPKITVKYFIIQFTIVSHSSGNAVTFPFGLNADVKLNDSHEVLHLVLWRIKFSMGGPSSRDEALSSRR